MARDGYLRGALADGARAFRYRAGVRELLGLPTGSGVRVRFASAAPRADFSYLCRSGDQATQVPVGIQRWLELAADDPVETSRAAVPAGPRSGPAGGPFSGVAERVSSGQPLPMDAAPGDVLVVPGITPRPGASWSAPERAESGRIEADGRPELFAETASESTDVTTAEGGRETATMPSGIRPVREAPPGPISIAEPVSSPVAIGQSSPTAVRIRPPVASTPYDEVRSGQGPLWIHNRQTIGSTRAHVGRLLPEIPHSSSRRQLPCPRRRRTGYQSRRGWFRARSGRPLHRHLQPGARSRRRRTSRPPTDRAAYGHLADSPQPERSRQRSRTWRNPRRPRRHRSRRSHRRARGRSGHLRGPVRRCSGNGAISPARAPGSCDECVDGDRHGQRHAAQSARR